MKDNIKRMIVNTNGVIDINHALQSKWFGTQWSCEDSDYENLNWLSEDVDKPSKSDIDAEIVRLQAEWDAQDYARDRAKAYPSIEDVTVALAEKAEGNSDMWDDITAKRQAVKDKYPKPTE